MLLLLAACSASLPEPGAGPVEVYFVNTSLEAIETKSQRETPAPFVLYPVARKINSATPERTALDELLKGPGEEERRLGYSSMLEGFTVSEFEIKDRTATINLMGEVRLTGLLAGPRLRQQIEKTLHQFGTIDSVVLRINGREDFDSLK